MKITVLKDGPLLINGPIIFKIIGDEKMQGIEQDVIALCRCGASEKKPLCDGSHKDCDFKARAAEIEKVY